MLGPLATGLFGALRPLPGALEEPTQFAILLGAMGWTVDRHEVNLASLAPVARRAEDLVASGDRLVAQLEARQRDEAVVAAELLLTVRDLIDLIGSLATVDGRAIAPALSDPKLWAELALDLPEYLLLREMEASAPVLFAVLRLAGVIMVEPASSAPPGRMRIDRKRLVWDNLVALVHDPAGYLASRYKWGTSAFDHARLLDDLWIFANGLGLPAERMPIRESLATRFYGATAPDDARELVAPFRRIVGNAGAMDLGLVMLAVPPNPGQPIDGIYLTNLAYGNTSATLDLGGGWTFTARGDLDATGAAGVRVRPAGADLPVALPTAEVELAVEGRPQNGWYVLGSAAGGAYLRASGLRHAVRIRKDAQGAELIVELRTVAGAHGEPGIDIGVAPAEGGGFVEDLLGAIDLHGGADLILTWSTRDGLALQGGLGLLATIPIQKMIGPVCLQSATAGLEVTTEGAALEASLTASAALGPLVIAIDRIGARLELLPANDSHAVARIGDLALAAGFKPPSGMGLAIDAADIVSGGGFLGWDVAAGRYWGVAELSALGVGVGAFGILTTQAPDGSEGWSLLLSISTKFVPIPLPFGFTLNGVGGLIAVNRTMDTEALADGMAAGSLDALLFPSDPVAQAPTLLSLLDAGFPVAQGCYAFGLMARIGWGAPTLVTVDLGILFTLPDPVRIALIGQLEVALPTPEAAQVELHVDVLGALDLGAGTIAIDAMLRDSHIVGLTLSGAMSFRASLTGQPNMLLSFGGFHPDFNPPSDVPDLDRLRVALDLGAEIRVSLGCYLALTSNSVQMGAHLNALMSSGKFEVEGNVAFDTLIQFDPFEFEIGLGYSVEVRYGQTTLAGVHLDLTLTGPSPWHGIGRATFTIVGIDVPFRVEGSFGRDTRESIESIDLASALATELAGAEAWAAPAASVTAVRLRAGAEDRIDPSGSIEVRQRLAPLGIALDHCGTSAIVGPRTLSISAPTVGGLAATDSRDLEDWFASAQYFEMRDHDKLSGPSFESFPAGLAFGGAVARTGSTLDISLEYEYAIIDGPAASKRGRVPVEADRLASSAEAPRHSGAVKVEPLRYLVTQTRTNRPQSGLLTGPVSWAAASRALDRQVNRGSTDRDALQIVPEHEALTEAV